MVAPRAGRRVGVAVDDGEVDPPRLAALELRLELRLRARVPGEDDETRGVLVDPMDDKRPPLAERPEVILDLLVDRRRVAFPLQRYAEQARRLVDDEQGLVLEDDVEIADLVSFLDWVSKVDNQGWPPRPIPRF